MHKNKFLSWIANAILIILFFTLPFQFIFILFIALFFIAIFITHSSERKFNTLEAKLATSKIGSLAMGLVEVKGEIKADVLRISPGTQEECLAYIYKRYEHVGKDKNGNKKYNLVEELTDQADLYIEDDTGRAWIDTKDLEILNYQNTQHDLPDGGYFNEALLIGGDVMVIGEATLKEGEKWIVRDRHHNLLTLKSYASVQLTNYLAPLKRATLFYTALLALIVAIIITTPYKFDGSTLSLYFGQSSLINWLFTVESPFIFPMDLSWANNLANIIMHNSTGDYEIIPFFIHFLGSLLLIILFAILQRVSILSHFFHFLIYVVMAAFFPNLIIGFAFIFLGIDPIKMMIVMTTTYLLAILFTIAQYDNIKLLNSDEVIKLMEDTEST